MKIKFFSLLALIATLAACGGGSSDAPVNQVPPNASSSTASSATDTSNTSANAVTSTATSTIPSTPLVTLRHLSETESLSLLTDAARMKIAPNFLTRIFREEKAEFLIEFVSDTNQERDLTQLAIVLTQQKSAVFSTFPQSDYVLLGDFNVLPMSFLRTNDRTALINFLNHNGVKAIYENEKGQLSRMSTVIRK